MTKKKIVQIAITIADKRRIEALRRPIKNRKKYQHKQETARDVIHRALNLLEGHEVPDENMQLGEMFSDFMTMNEKKIFGEMSCECPECGRVFDNTRGLRTHYSQAHPDTRKIK